MKNHSSTVPLGSGEQAFQEGTEILKVFESDGLKILVNFNRIAIVIQTLSLPGFL